MLMLLMILNIQGVKAENRGVPVRRLGSSWSLSLLVSFWLGESLLYRLRKSGSHCSKTVRMIAARTGVSRIDRAPNDTILF
jgi:hypothetical protein